jgi:hypothetical protein
VHGSFHFISKDAEANAAVIRELAKSGQSVAGFGDTTEPFGGQPEQEQKARIERMVDGFHRVLGADFAVPGLRAPLGQTDAATEKAAATLDYLVDIGRVDSLVPVLSEAGHVVLFSASANFDANSSGESVTSGLEEGLRKALMGGYVFAGFDLAGLRDDSPMDGSLLHFLQDPKPRESIWMGSGEEVATWWRERSGIRISSAWQPAESLLVLDVSAAEPVRAGAAIELTPPAGRSARIEEAPAGVELQSAGNSTALVLTGLSAGSHRLRVRFVP